MKKIITLLTVLAVCSTVIFAAPASIATALSNPTAEKSQTFTSFSGEDDLFATVQGTALTDFEADAIQGDGFIGGLAGFITGFIGGVMQWGTGAAIMGTNGTGQQQASSMLSSAIIAGIFGAVAGFLSPTP